MSCLNPHITGRKITPDLIQQCFSETLREGEEITDDDYKINGDCSMKCPSCEGKIQFNGVSLQKRVLLSPSTVPTVATGTFCPASTLGAPQTICIGSSTPTFTVVTDNLSVFGC